MIDDSRLQTTVTFYEKFEFVWYNNNCTVVPYCVLLFCSAVAAFLLSSYIYDHSLIKDLCRRNKIQLTMIRSYRQDDPPTPMQRAEPLSTQLFPKDKTRQNGRHGDPPTPIKRADPQGSRATQKSSAQVLAELRLLEVLVRTGTAREPSTSALSPADELKKTNENKDILWNSFTGTHHGGGEQLSGREETSNQSLDQLEASPDQEHVRERKEQLSFQRTRRVQFAEKLSFERKQASETPKTSTLPILKNYLQRGKPQQVSDKENIGRDPTPKSSNESSKKQKKVNADDGAQHLITKDPPTNASDSLLFSPAVNNQKSKTPGEESREVSLETWNLGDAIKLRRAMEQAATQPLRAYSPPPDSWDLADVHPREALEETGWTKEPAPPVLGASFLEALIRREGMTLSDVREARHTSDSTSNKNLMQPAPPTPLPLYYFPQPNLEDIPQFEPFAIPQFDLSTMAASAVDATNDLTLSDRWKETVASPTNSSADESQTAYLINKYTKGPRVARNSGHIRTVTVAKPAGSYGPMSPSASGARSTRVPDARSPRSIRLIASGLSSRAGPRDDGKKSSIQRSYSKLDICIADQGTGTELILLPDIPKHIMIYGDDGISTNAVYDIEAGKKKMPIIAVSYDEKGIRNQNTEGTDDSDSGIYCDGRGSGWDRFDARSETSGQEHDDEVLIPSKELAVNTKRRLLFLIWVVTASLAAVLAYHFAPIWMSSSNPNDSVRTSDCANSISNNVPFSQRYVEIRDHLVTSSVGDTSQLDLARTPQRKALCWISDYDERQLPTQENNTVALLQRYTLGVLYYALVDENSDNPDSLKNTDYLSSDHECAWGVIVCSSLETVTALLLSDKLLTGPIPAEIGNLEYLGERKRRK
jgi:hypothetical protein